jgi:hypothetical protein
VKKKGTSFPQKSNYVTDCDTWPRSKLKELLVIFILSTSGSFNAMRVHPMLLDLFLLHIFNLVTSYIEAKVAKKEKIHY